MEENNELDSRKLLILKAVIDDYIESFEPVGSRTIAKKYDLGLSSATIRNEMADLEEMGYLSQPHASAGRIPSTKGYRTYVDQMLQPAAENPVMAGKIIGMLEDKMAEYNKLMKACAQIISEMTQYTAIGVAPGSESFVIKALQIVPVDSEHVLVVIVVANNSIKSKLVTLRESLTPQQVIELSQVINNSFSGRPTESISLMMINKVVELTGVSREAVLPIVDGIIDCAKQCEANEVFTEGASKMLKCPEFDDIEKARNFIDLIQDHEVLDSIVKSSGDAGSGLSVTIGTENQTDGLNDYSVVSAKYEVDGVTIGSVSVVGPTRMDYKKVISSLEYMRKMLEKKVRDEGRLLEAGSINTNEEG